MTRYASGRRQEWIVQHMLESAGAYVTQRSGGSRGKADIIALYSDLSLALQVKSGVTKPSSAEHEIVREASEHTQATWAMVHIHRGKTQCWTYRGGKAHKVPVPGLGAR